ncbi:MAG: hypothetical protein P8N52_05765 [Crocinitomicaceae bacterium]|nr:hypothetical protein [Crocinitomicaceae bacterium]MDG1775814.1 hypothetical protein [Crocinitomicaceae bacterium]
MRFLLINLLLILFVITSCSEQKHQLELSERVDCQPFLFNMQQPFSDNEYNMSFPLWFNDTVLKQQRIKKIILNAFPASQGVDVSENTPKQKKVYLFNDEGDLISAQFEQFYENTNVGSSLFNYSTPKDENGFSRVEEVTDSNLEEHTTGPYSIYEKIGYGSKVLRYRDKFSGNQLFYMLDKKNWGALSVDSILNPTAEDQIVLGTPLMPHKSYQVENIVKETNGINFGYDNTGEFVQEISYDAYPFRTKRSINYDNNGICIGFVDSMFSSKGFMNSEFTSFETHAGLPVKIIRETRLNESKSSCFHVETIEYFFWEVN